MEWLTQYRLQEQKEEKNSIERILKNGKATEEIKGLSYDAQT